MTTHTPAPAIHESVQALRDLRLGVEMDRHNLDDGDAKLQALDAAIDALSKLRAPVADGRVALSQYDYQALFDAIGKAVKVHPNLAIEISVQAFRAALASAHVAGEAAIYLDAGHLREVRAGNDMPVSASTEPGHGMVPYYAAPQASEAVSHAGYAGVTVWVGDRQATQIVTQQGLELSNEDELLERFEVARAALSAQPGAQKEKSDA